LYDHAQRSNRVGGLWHNQLQHNPELVRGDSSCELHHQQLHRIEEWNLDWNGNWHNIFRDRPCRFDLLQLHG
jgi:hypothetical protein